MKKNLYAAILLCLSFAAKAQNNFGIETSNWSGTSNVYLNPANIADNRMRFSIDILTVSGGLDNNLGTINTNGGIIGAINKGNTDNIFSYSNANSFNLLAPFAEVRGPGFMWSITPKHSIALTTRIRGINQFNNFDQSLYHTVADPNYVTTGDIDLTSKNFNYTAHIWSEVGLSYGVVLLDKDNSELKAGVTARYLGGIGYIGIKGNNLDAHFKSGNDSFYASNSDIEYSSNIVSTNSVLNNGINNNSILSEFFGAKAGSGFGGDIGIVYDYIPDKNKRYDNATNKYLWRISASVLDMGSILYNGSDNSTARITGNGYLTGQGLIDNVKSFSDFKNYAVQQGFTADTGRGSTRVYMPTRLLVNADYNVYKNFYVNAAYVASLANRQNYGNSFYDQATITPRYDTKLWSVALPVSYSVLSSSMKLGLGARITGFFIGSDDMLALFAKKQYGFNFYVGGYVPFYKQKMKDRDKDGVPDDKDKCPDEAGTWENNGCPVEPDMDHGGKPDTTDNCPDMVRAEIKSDLPKPAWNNTTVFERNTIATVNNKDITQQEKEDK